MNETIEDSLINLDGRIMYLEDNLQQMNLQMMKKDQMIEILQKKMKNMEERLKDLDERKANRSSITAEDERPPHY